MEDVYARVTEETQRALFSIADKENRNINNVIQHILSVATDTPTRYMDIPENNDDYVKMRRFVKIFKKLNENEKEEIYKYILKFEKNKIPKRY